MRYLVEKEELPILVSEIIKRMDGEEKMELSKRLSWEELEEWKATYDILIDKKLVRKINIGLLEEKKGKIKSADRVFKS